MTDLQPSSQPKDWILDEEFIVIFHSVVKYNKSRKILHILEKEMTYIQNRQMKNIFEINTYIIKVCDRTLGKKRC